MKAIRGLVILFCVCPFLVFVIWPLTLIRDVLETMDDECDDMIECIKDFFKYKKEKDD